MQFKIDPALPAPVIAALKSAQFEYSQDRAEFLEGLKGQYDVEFSVTDLTRPTKQLWLTRKFKDDLVVDLVKDNFYSLLGSVTHWILQRYAPHDSFVEQRNYVIFNVNGVRVLVHGQYDLFDIHTETLDDYKLTSGWGFLYEKKEYEFQLNANKYLTETRYPAHKAKYLRNIYMFRHLDRRAQEMNPEYPRENIMIKNYRPWERSVTEARILELVQSKLRYRLASWTSLPDCTDEERWIRDTKWSVYKRKKAAKKGEIPDFSSRAAGHFETEEAAKAYASEAGEDTKIIKHTGEAKRCGEFCPVAPFCRQYQDELKAATEGKPEILEE